MHELAVRGTGTTGQQPDEQGAQPVEVHRAIGHQGLPPARGSRQAASSMHKDAEPDRKARVDAREIEPGAAPRRARPGPARAGRGPARIRCASSSTTARLRIGARAFLTRFRPVRGHRGRAEPFHGDVGRPVIQPRIEHANHRRMFEPRRHRDQGTTCSRRPAFGHRTGSGTLRTWSLRSLHPRPPRDTRSHHDPPRAGSGGGSGPAPSLTSFRSELAPERPEPAASRLKSILQDEPATRNRAGSSTGGAPPCSLEAQDPFPFLPARRPAHDAGMSRLEWRVDSAPITSAFGTPGGCAAQPA